MARFYSYYRESKPVPNYPESWNVLIIATPENQYEILMVVNGKKISGLPTTLDYIRIKNTVRRLTGVRLPKHTNLIFAAVNKIRYAYVYYRNGKIRICSREEVLYKVEEYKKVS